MTAIIQLGADEIVETRPFTHPDHVADDRRILRYMVDQLCLILEYVDFYQHLQQPMEFYQPAFHRVVFSPTARDRVNQPLMLVGFFGDRRPAADATQVSELDDILIKEIPNHPGIFSYCTLEVKGNNYANLVLFGSDEAKQQWGASQAHAEAAQQLAPAYYNSVRIHNGILPHGLAASHLLHLERVKYFDYTHRPMWRAIRHLETAAPSHSAA